MMSETALDAKKWSKCISDSRGLSELLKDRIFLKEKVEYATMIYKKKPVSPLYLVGTLANVLEADERVMDAVERIPNCSDTTTRRIILHWYAILVYLASREFGLIVTDIQKGGQ